MIRKKLIALASAFLMVTGVVAGTTAAYAATGQISMELLKAAFIVGGTGGKGTLTFNGQNYPLSIGGLSAGWQISLSAVNLRGTVRNINSPQDIEGVYSAAGAGLAVAAGAKAAVMVNSKGVTLEVAGVQMGVDASLNLEGLSITLKR
ncbi:hypothetical protein [Microbaculum marinum]|uniref:DUF1134 domain-containing protein n=1 Tax=Microbaculum marinum TaxID=1764581 RepID=A0AAW9RR23_9HYPH